MFYETGNDLVLNCCKYKSWLYLTTGLEIVAVTHQNKMLSTRNDYCLIFWWIQIKLENCFALGMLM